MSEEPIRVELRRSGRGFVWDEGAESLLTFLEDQGLDLPFSCRAGICSTCKQRLVSGEIAYFEEPLDEPDDGELLLCCSKPVTSVVIDI